MMIRLLRALLAPLSVAVMAQGLAFIGVSNRIITPNSDGKNDTAEFLFSNDGHENVTGTIFNVRGAQVSGMTANCVDNGVSPGVFPWTCLQWDGRSGGNIVPSGVYIYQISAQGWSYSGTVVVIK